MFLLLAELHAHPDAAHEVESTLRELTGVVRAEPGNIIYVVHKVRDAADRFVLYELYDSEQSCKLHLDSPPVKQALQRFETLLQAPPRILFCEMAAHAGIVAAWLFQGATAEINVTGSLDALF